MPSNCIFEFDRPEVVYYSGEVVQGRIHLQTTKEKTVKEVYILFEGNARVSWSERKSRTVKGKTQYYTQSYSGFESYVNSRSVVFGDGKLSPGTHTYTFVIPLPVDCPSSCVESYGRISYTISLVLNRPLRFDNIFKQPLSVIRQLNLNLRPELLIPIKHEDVKYFCCWPCSSGPVMSVLTIPFGGYAPGQTINFKLEIDNQSTGYDLNNGIVLKLKNEYRFIAENPSGKVKYQTNLLSSSEMPLQCLRLSKKLIDGVLTIPPVPPTSNDGIIKVGYEIKVEIKTGACHTDQDLEIPITIGTIPLAQSVIHPENAAALPPTAPPDSPAHDDKPPSYDFYKPPAFEETTAISGTFIDPNVDEHNRVDDFIPKYPMYTNFAEPTAPPPDGADQKLLP